MENLLPIAIILLITVWAIIYANERAKKRRMEMQMLAEELGFHFQPQKDRYLARKFEFIKHIKQGSNRYAYNIMTGISPVGETVQIFDYHFQVQAGKHTHHYNFSILSVILPRSLPELQIEPEGIISKIKHATGFGDIDFESLEFSKRYDVRSKDKKFAYDFCNSQMIEYLMRNRDLIIEVDQRNLVLIFNELLPPALYRANHRRMLEIRDLMPDYLFN